MQLFDFENIPITVLDNDGKITYWDNFLTENEAINLFNQLLTDSEWKEEMISVYGKRYQQPRLTCWYGEYGVLADGGYQAIAKAMPLTASLQFLKDKIEQETGYRFNCILANLYRDENDSVGYHADDEPILGINPVIASYSLGETRRFLVKHNQQTYNSLKVDLTNNSLLLMDGCLQHFWQHAIPKTKRPMNARINLTFRLMPAENKFLSPLIRKGTWIFKSPQ
ncbi:alpha-ketoglutarate-dependent dioxygenase AlkB family protein [Psychromonas sp. Urea-02u-13]|uniref:alpha-ketoglutarate-dependent dioxygenase AlkB family protein n=1 Tax=Psychromonas sp. Urea-02u-13 TaxID=2058326 RepID=UPI0018E2FB39|nr:alpha-ketoglutarate-dependent dioxygenase AlkB [Psychromonas sp. Urea-02u-13]